MKFLLNSKIFSGALVFLIAVFSLSLIRINSERLSVKEEVQVMENKIEDAQKDQDYLKKTVSFLTDRSFLERQARAKYNFKYPGEEVAFVYPSEATISSANESTIKNLPNYAKWWYYLLGKKAQ